MRISEASCTSSTYHGGVMREGGREGVSKSSGAFNTGRHGVVRVYERKRCPTPHPPPARSFSVLLRCM